MTDYFLDEEQIETVSQKVFYYLFCLYGCKTEENETAQGPSGSGLDIKALGLVFEYSN